MGVIKVESETEQGFAGFLGVFESQHGKVYFQ